MSGNLEGVPGPVFEAWWQTFERVPDPGVEAMVEGHPAPEAEHQAQSPVFHSPATDKACGELLRHCLRSVPRTGSQGWSSSWWANGEWGEQESEIEWQEREMSRTGGSGMWYEHQQWQQPASDNASTWGAGPGETWVPWGATHGEPGHALADHALVASTQDRAPLGPAETGPGTPWSASSEVSGQWV